MPKTEAWWNNIIIDLILTSLSKRRIFLPITPFRIEITKRRKGQNRTSGKEVELGDKPRLFVGGLEESVTDSQLKELFQEIGPVTDTFVASGEGAAPTDMFVSKMNIF